MAKIWKYYSEIAMRRTFEYIKSIVGSIVNSILSPKIDIKGGYIK